MPQRAILIIVNLFLPAPSLILSQTMTKENIDSAEKLIDLKFTDAEKILCLDILKSKKAIMKR